MTALWVVLSRHRAILALWATWLLALAKALQQLGNIYFFHLLRPPLLHSYSGYSLLTVFIILRKS